MRSVLEAPQGLAVGPAGSGGLGLVAVEGRQARNSSPSGPLHAKNFAQHARKHQFWVIFRTLGELFRAQDALRW